MRDNTKEEARSGNKSGFVVLDLFVNLRIEIELFGFVVFYFFLILGFVILK